MNETNMQGGIIEGAEWNGWQVYHVAGVGAQKRKVKCPECTHQFTVDMRGHLRNQTAVGYPDLTLVHGQRAMFLLAECKDSYRDQQLPVDQLRWRQVITEASRYGARVAHAVWRPKHYDDVLKYLADPQAELPNESLWLPTD